MNFFNPSNWFWLVQDSNASTQVWSSAFAEYLPVSNAVYSNWLSQGNTPTTIATQDSLCEVLQNLYPAGSPAKSTVITPLQFMSRFTPTEQVTIATAALSNSEISLFQLQAGYALDVDLANSITVNAVTDLETFGLIANGRATQILTP